MGVADTELQTPWSGSCLLFPLGVEAKISRRIDAHTQLAPPHKVSNAEKLLANLVHFPPRQQILKFGCRVDELCIQFAEVGSEVEVLVILWIHHLGACMWRLKTSAAWDN